MLRVRAAFVLVLVLAGCGSPPPPGPPVVLPEPGAPAPPVVRRPVEPLPMPEAPAPVSPTAVPQPTTVPAAETPVVVPAGAVYACVVDSAGERQVTAIEFAPRVAALCAQNPEMGPCQYEREVCRRNGGRVFAADGKEITKATEAEYDRRVLRARIRAD